MFSPAPCIFLSILCYVYRVKVLINLYLWYISNDRRVGVSFAVYDMLHTDAKGYIIMCTLVKLAFCLCCELLDPRMLVLALVFGN